MVFHPQLNFWISDAEDIQSISFLNSNTKSIKVNFEISSKELFYGYTSVLNGIILIFTTFIKKNQIFEYKTKYLREFSHQNFLQRFKESSDL